ncbi:fungal specific transcription factor domain-containing protein [Ophiocordyceps camponoti-floridani]|uniref:Fungal specific transcription factor domain-containing protein n=1 Tax=Ophiocordyceps camponoti-floridani TaxID=2030778 RepID=A0A8H4QAM8_9HYPO|nr:fungal specific transcription factor domain-containing protein [Ophiocordyceps camponoti-floridani]
MLTENDGSASPQSPPDVPQRPPRSSSVYQTTGPDARSGPVLAPTGSGSPALNPRSCVTCRRRKVRCDKQMPCSNCRRALIPCVFPAPGRAPRQQRPRDSQASPRTSSQRELALVKRLRKLEGLVDVLNTRLKVHEPAVAEPDKTADARISPVSSGPRRIEAVEVKDSTGERDIHLSLGHLVLDDQRGTSRYASSDFWSKLEDELDSIREESHRLTDEPSDDDDSDGQGTPADSPMTAISAHQGFIFGYRSTDVALEQYHPPSSWLAVLWSTYRQNVEPLIKLFHIPTADLVIRAARAKRGLPPSREALVFAICFAAVTSLEPDEVKAKFATDKNHLLSQYRFALEQSLARAHFLDTSETAVLQAFTLFLIVVRRHDESRFCWALTGLLIRIAQGMGLHRDGTNFKLPPLETEVRRRLWWAILMLDVRSAEELGSDMIIGEQSYDTQMPSNIDDTDVGTGTINMPTPREGRSDCAVALVRAEICAAMRRLATAASASKTDEAGSMAEREERLVQHHQRVEQRLLRHELDETEDSLYWTAAMIARVTMAKMFLFIYQPILFRESEHELPDELRQRIYVAAIEVIEYSHKLNTDGRCRQYRWLFNTYTNWHAIAYTLIESCRRPWTALVERGWEAVTGYDEDPVEIARRADHAAVFLPLRRLFAKARRHREAELARLRADQDEARRLDAAERRSPAQASFGPAPGAEGRMEQAREKWQTLIKPDVVGCSPLSVEQSASVLSLGALPRVCDMTSQTLPPANNPAQMPMNMTREAMLYVNELMSLPHTEMTEFWHLAKNDEAKGTGLAASLPPQPAKDNDLPPYLWPDPLSLTSTNPVDDVEMLGEGFDWKDWSQNIRGMDMGAQPPWPPGPENGC